MNIDMQDQLKTLYALSLMPRLWLITRAQELIHPSEKFMTYIAGHLELAYASDTVAHVYLANLPQSEYQTRICANTTATSLSRICAASFLAESLQDTGHTYSRQIAHLTYDAARRNLSRCYNQPEMLLHEMRVDFHRDRLQAPTRPNERLYLAEECGISTFQLSLHAAMAIRSNPLKLREQGC